MLRRRTDPPVRPFVLYRFPPRASTMGGVANRQGAAVTRVRTWLWPCGHAPGEVRPDHDAVRCRRVLDAPLTYLAGVLARQAEQPHED